jgi:hypothetical protein
LTTRPNPVTLNLILGPPVLLRVALSRTLIYAWEASFFQSLHVIRNKLFSL